MKKVLGMMFVICFMIICSFLTAQEQNITEYAFGTVNSISPNQVIISEYDYDNEVEKNGIYVITAETEYENASSHKDISEGDDLEIEYILKDGKNTAVLIVAEKPENEEEGFLIEEVKE